LIQFNNLLEVFMKVIRLLLIITCLTAILLIQSCGSSSSGGGSVTDTAGALTATQATAVNNNDSSYTVSTTVTYEPPIGKTAQGVVVKIVSTDSNGIVLSSDHTLSSGSNSFTYSFPVLQSAASSTHVVIVASIGGMKSSTSVVIPKYVLPLVLGMTVVNFNQSSASNTAQNVTISGGSTPYSIVSSVPADISAAMGATDIVVTLLNMATTSPPVAATAIVTITDSSSPALTSTLTVNYFK
jgi:hypothetical protein